MIRLTPHPRSDICDGCDKSVQVLFALRAGSEDRTGRAPDMVLCRECVREMNQQTTMVPTFGVTA